MKPLIILFAISISTILPSCNKLQEGIVVQKWHEPTTEYVTTMPVVVSDGKNFTTILVPYFIIDNEDWCIKIKGKYKGKDRTETVYISEQEYKCLSKGDWFKLDKDCSLSDNNNIKEEQ